MTWKELSDIINSMPESQQNMEAIVIEPMFDEDTTIEELVIPEDELDQPKIKINIT